MQRILSLADVFVVKTDFVEKVHVPENIGIILRAGNIFFMSNMSSDLGS